MPLITDSPPPTPVDPVTEILHGVAITDPYRWLEDQNSPRTRKWLEEQAAYTRAYLDALPGRDRIRKRVEELLAVEVVSEPWKIGNRYFFLKRAARQEQPVIMMREGDSGEEVVLVDPALRSDGPETSVNIINISRDASVLAYGIRRGGAYFQSVEFLDVVRREVLPDRLPLGFGPWLVFSSNGTAFYYSHEIVGSSRPYYRAVYKHRFGTRSDEDLEIFPAGEDRNLHVTVCGQENGQFLTYLVTWLKDPIRSDLYFHDLASGELPHKIVDGMESLFFPFFAGNFLMALTDWKAPNLRIVAIDPDQSKPDQWIDIVPESQQRIKDFALAENFIFVGRAQNISSVIEVFHLSGCRHGNIPCPAKGSARLFPRSAESDNLFYEFSSFDHPPIIFSYHPASGEQKVWAKSQVKIEPSSVEFEQVRYNSKDGTPVPMSLVSRKGWKSSSPLPTFLTGYGGFGTCRTPQFNAYSTFLIEHGFLFALANLRGGGEFGSEWHRAGKRHNRQNAINDFIAAAEWLVASGYSRPEMIAIGGGSNAGLLTGAALTQRPDLFRAAVCLGPLLDMLRYHIFDSANRWVDEYGSSEDPEDFQHLLAYSPYHHVECGVPYPSVLFVSGDTDTACNPMHSLKMTARLQEATTSGRPILLDHSSTWGHAPLQPLTKRIDALTDRLAFVCHELGVRV